METIRKETKVIKSETRESITIELRSDIIKEPKCHDQEKFTLVRIINTNKGEIERPIVEIDPVIGMKILNEDEKWSNVYYSDLDDKVAILNKLKESIEDEFFHDAPGEEYINLIKEIDELKKKMVATLL